MFDVYSSVVILSKGRCVVWLLAWCADGGVTVEAGGAKIDARRGRHLLNSRAAPVLAALVIPLTLVTYVAVENGDGQEATTGVRHRSISILLNYALQQ